MTIGVAVAAVAGVAIIALVVVVLQFTPESSVTPAGQFTSAGRSRSVVRDWLEENTSDPSQLEIIEIGPPLNLADAYVYRGHGRYSDIGSWERFGYPGQAVYVKVREAGLLGGKMVTERQLIISEGRVLDAVSENSVRQYLPVLQPDKSFDELRDPPGELDRPPYFDPKSPTQDDEGHTYEFAGTGRRQHGRLIGKSQNYVCIEWVRGDGWEQVILPIPLLVEEDRRYLSSR